MPAIQGPRSTRGGESAFAAGPRVGARTHRPFQATFCCPRTSRRGAQARGGFGAERSIKPGRFVASTRHRVVRKQPWAGARLRARTSRDDRADARSVTTAISGRHTNWPQNPVRSRRFFPGAPGPRFKPRNWMGRIRSPPRGTGGRCGWSVPRAGGRGPPAAVNRAAQAPSRNPTGRRAADPGGPFKRPRRIVRAADCRARRA